MEQVSTHRYSLTKISSNRKLGPMACTYTSRDSCPASCSFTGSQGCYASAGGPTSLHWRKLDTAGLTLDDLCAGLSRLPKHSQVRLNVAGDLPHVGRLIDTKALTKVINAVGRLQAFTYTHADLREESNREAIKAANRNGLTVNVSAESLSEADAYADLGIGPVVVAVPRGTPKTSRTPGGRHVVICPAEYSDMTCNRCMVCAKPNRKAIIAFSAHGSGAKKVEAVFWAKQV